MSAAPRSSVVPPTAPECSVDECYAAPILGTTISYWGMETWIYLCGKHLIEKRRAGEEYIPPDDEAERPQGRDAHATGVPAQGGEAA